MTGRRRSGSRRQHRAVRRSPHSRRDADAGRGIRRPPADRRVRVGPAPRVRHTARRAGDVPSRAGRAAEVSSGGPPGHHPPPSAPQRRALRRKRGSVPATTLTGPLRRTCHWAPTAVDVVTVAPAWAGTGRHRGCARNRGRFSWDSPDLRPTLGGGSISDVHIEAHGPNGAPGLNRSRFRRSEAMCGQGRGRTADLPLFRRSVPARTTGSSTVVSPALPA